jgi:hypothetical protein
MFFLPRQTQHGDISSLPVFRCSLLHQVNLISISVTVPHSDHILPYRSYLHVSERLFEAGLLLLTLPTEQRSIGATRMYRTLSDRQAGNLYEALSFLMKFINGRFKSPLPVGAAPSFDFWETSRDETTGEIRFRRQTQLVAHDDGNGAGAATSTALPMGRLVRTQLQPEERYVERFEARDIDLDDDSVTTKDAKPSNATDSKSETDWVAHAK